jgi:hypothetical protein
MTSTAAPSETALRGTAPGGPLHEALRARALHGARLPPIDAAVRELVAAAQGQVAGVVFYGSRRTQAARADAHSAHDIFLVLRSYGAAYRAFAAAGKIGRPPWLLAFLNTFLPPNQVSLRFGTPPLHLKCSALSLRAFLRETSERRQDHFCIGRLFQPCQILYAADEETKEALVGALVLAFAETYRWGRPWLPERFDAEAYGRRLLEISLGREIRPEPSGRAEALWKAQREEQIPVFALLLEDLRARGELREMAPGSYALEKPVTWVEQAGLRYYFTRSLVRATLRWLKHMATFEGWLDYILLKARRHTGEEIVLTERERKYPLVLLWPRVFRYLRRKDAKRP